MAFQKGEGGRPEGAKNKASLIGKDKISSYLEDKGYKNLMDEIDKLTGFAKVQSLLKLMEFVMPKLKAVDHTSDGETVQGLTTVVFTSTGVPPIENESDISDS